MTHACIRPGCAISYESNEEDAYYCPEHLAEKKAIARTIDAKIKTTNQQPSSLLTEYDNSPKVGKFVIAKL